MTCRLISLCILLTAIGFGATGCAEGYRQGKVEEYYVLRGLSICEIEDVFLSIKEDATHPANLYLFIDDQQTVNARLRRGEEFVLSNGNDYAERYRVMLLDPKRIVLKRLLLSQREVQDRDTVHAGLRTREQVIAVKPYNLERLY